jgi:tRNA (guanine37-N1)-methyltransferase
MAKSKRIQFDILTIFPEIFNSYFGESIIKRAQEKKLVKIKAHDIRKFSKDKHRKVDDKPFGGGAGMVLSAQPVLSTVASIKKQVARRKNFRTKTVIMSAKGKRFNQKMAYEWANKYDQIVFISGRYEGIDERVAKILKAEEISIGDYVLTDGDVAAMTIVSAVTRLIPGVINWDSLKDESHWNLLVKDEAKKKDKGFEYPHYTRPEVLEWKGKKYRVPKVLLSGNHKEIAVWREEHSK